MYVAPEMEMIEVETEGPVLTDSPSGEGYNGQSNYGDDWY